MARIASTDIPVPGSTRSLRIFTAAGAPGPTLAVIGAIHGDELEGPLAIARVLERLRGMELAGTAILLPVANPDAVAAGMRCTPSDGRNLARCFPGRADGTPTEALAFLIGEQVIRRADALIDLHSAGTAMGSPTLAGYSDASATGPAARAMARAFGAPVVWRHGPPVAPGRTLSLAEEIGIPSIYTEASGGTVPQEEVVACYAGGVLRVMAHLGMTAERFPPPPPPLSIIGDGNTDAPTAASPVAGLVTAHVGPGQRVARGQNCVTIHDAGGAVLARIGAETDGWTVFVRRARWAEPGDLLFALAQTDPQEPPADDRARG